MACIHKLYELGTKKKSAEGVPGAPARMFQARGEAFWEVVGRSDGAAEEPDRGDELRARAWNAFNRYVDDGDL